MWAGATGYSSYQMVPTDDIDLAYLCHVQTRLKLSFLMFHVLVYRLLLMLMAFSAAVWRPMGQKQFI